ncbi:MAG: nodulation protein NfeD [Elusimicrobiota bacterium]
MRRSLALFLGLGLLLPAWAAETAKTKESHDKSAQAPRVLVAPYSGIIHPVAAEFIEGAIRRAEDEGFDALVLQLDTPGGLDLSMRIIVKAVMNAELPVIVFVHPAGSRAASAGVFITMAAHVAAMTPGTNIGAAHPVAIPMMGGAKPGKEKKDDILETKAVSDAAAYLRSIAQKRGRNQDWAYEAVSKSTSIPAGEALALGVVDLLAEDLPELLKKADGRTLPDFEKPLRTAGASVERYEMTRRQRWLAAVSDPNVAMILMSLGAGGMFIELYNPGLILPGIVGAVCLLLAFYSFQTLSASYAGVLLIVLGMVFFLLEIKVTSYGLLALGGVAAMLLGVLMLFQQSMGGLGVSWSVIISSLAGLLGVTAVVSYLVYQTYRRKIPTGMEGMVGLEGAAIGELAPKGKVRVQGEIWEAASEAGALSDGAEIVVTAVKGMRLSVAPLRRPAD